MGQQWAAPFVYLGPLSPGAYTGRGLSGRSYVLCLMAIEYETRLPISAVVGRFDWVRMVFGGWERSGIDRADRGQDCLRWEWYEYRWDQ